MRLAMAVVVAVTCELLALSSFDHGPIIQVTAQPQLGADFVSIDCGGSSTSYTDNQTGLFWTSDSNGFGLESVSRAANVSSPAQYQWLSSMRIFEGNQTKYCYVFNDTNGIVQSNPYLVRASFWTGDKPPFDITPNKEQISFMLLINADEWSSIDISLPQKKPLVMEVYVVAMWPTMSVCVAGHGKTAFISSLELRPILNNFTAVQTFKSSQGNAGAMFLYSRLDFGSAKDVRFPDDAYDRIWSADTRGSVLNTTSYIQTGYSDAPPNVVLQTALVANSSFNITFDGFSRSYKFFYLIYLAEILHNVTARKRVFSEETITASGVQDQSSNIDLAAYSYSYAYVDDYGYSVSVDEGGFITFSFERNATSSLGPLVNALELQYISQDPMSLGTDPSDVLTLESIKGSLSGFDSWSGDPCLPYSYEWLTCDSEIRPRIIKLSLQNRNITAEIPTEIGNLKALVELDLQGNHLSGSIPQSIAQLSNLTTLFLQDNNLSGAIPQALLDKNVYLRLEGNPILCKDNNATYCNQVLVQTTNNESKKSRMLIVVVLTSICAVVLILLASIFIFHFRRKGKNDGAVVLPHANILGRSNQAHEFTLQAIKTMTRNFERILGQGGFGFVYHGVLQNGKEVAVKLLAKDSRQGEQEFLNEVEFLSRVHHKNLVSLVGYCIESQLVLVYEFMANGSLWEALQGKGAKLFSWRDRLHIAVDAAEGLDYLHRGCNPSIVHRDVKSSNILLNDQFEGKISDFGISKSKLYKNTTMAGGSQTFTSVQGSFGYLDPAYAETNIANHSIDVYAFGIVLCELVTGKPPLIQQMTRSGEPLHILLWAKPQIDQGDISRLADATLYQDFNVSSMWKVIDVAMMCVEHDRRRRPNMNEIMLELKSALSMELQNNIYDTNSSDQQTTFTYTTDVSAR